MATNTTNDGLQEGGAIAEARARGIERQLEAAQQIAHIGSWEWDMRTNAVTWSDELYRIYGLAPRSCEITFESFLGRLHPDDRARVQQQVADALARGGSFAYPERILRPDGTVRALDTLGEVARGANGEVLGLIGTCRDVTDERLRAESQRVAQQLKADEQRVLEGIAAGAPLLETLTALVLAIEAHSPPTIGSILLLDETGTRVRDGAAPNLPDAYNRAVNGQPIGPAAGSCGTAAFTKSPIIVGDIETDLRWASYRELARAHGLRACWSFPVLATDGRVLGTFALYFREPREPRDEDLALVERASHVAGIAIERRQLEDQLRALSARVESVREEERTGIAREIHDELGQALTALKMDVAWIARRINGSAEIPREAVLEELAAMSKLMDEVINQVRRISGELRPGLLDDLGLLAALEWQAQEFERKTGTTCVVRSNLGDAQLDRNLSTAVFRIFQEALTNVVRHAAASNVDVVLERRDGWLRLEVNDDGKGITLEAAQNPRSLGLLGMRERARRLGGTATVGASPEGGTSVALALPIADAGIGGPP